MGASEISVKVVTLAGNTCAEVTVRSDTLVKALKSMLVKPCRMPVQLQQLILDGNVLEDSSQLSAYIGDSTSLIVTLVMTPLVYGFMHGAWGKIWVTGEGSDVLEGEEIGEEIVVEASTLKVEQ